MTSLGVRKELWCIVPTILVKCGEVVGGAVSSVYLTEKIEVKAQEVAGLREDVDGLRAALPDVTSTLREFVSSMKELNGGGQVAQRPLSAAEERRYS